MGLVFRQVTTPTVVGVVVGGLAALGLTRFMSDFLVGVEPTDPLTYFATAVIFSAIAAAAAMVPAMRALRVDPADALRRQ